MATDNDAEDEKATAYLMERTKRARWLQPPQGNDATDFWKTGGDLRAWVSEALSQAKTPNLVL